MSSFVWTFNGGGIVFSDLLGGKLTPTTVIWKTLLKSIILQSTGICGGIASQVSNSFAPFSSEHNRQGKVYLFHHFLLTITSVAISRETIYHAIHSVLLLVLNLHTLLMAHSEFVPANSTNSTWKYFQVWMCWTYRWDFGECEDDKSKASMISFKKGRHMIVGSCVIRCLVPVVIECRK
ncbi:hypothetical protein LINPERHAP1_LOCUS34306 [Linum perenne]